MSESYYNQGPPSEPHGRVGSTASYAPYSSTEQGYYPPPPQNSYGPYRPEDDSYRRSSRASNMQVGPARRGSYDNDDDEEDEEPRSHHRHHREGHASRSRSRRRSRSRNGSRSSAGERGHGHKADGASHKGEKKLAATVAGGALGAFAVHELGHGHHDIATVVGGLVGAYAGNKLEKKHLVKKEEKHRRESESQEAYYSGSGPQYGNSRDLIQDDGYERRGSRDGRQRSVNYVSSDSDSESDGERRRRRHRRHD